MVVQVEARHCFEEWLLRMLVFDYHAQVWVLEDAVFQGLNERFCGADVGILTGEFVGCADDNGIVEP